MEKRSDHVAVIEIREITRQEYEAGKNLLALQRRPDRHRKLFENRRAS